MSKFFVLICFILMVAVLQVAAGAAGATKDAAGADTDPAEFKNSMLLESVLHNDVAGLQKALEDGESIDTVNTNGWSAATFAVIQGNIEALQVLVENSIDLNSADNEGITPLMRAAQASDKEMVEILLAANASPLQATPDGQTAYSMAKDSGRKLVALLIAESAALHAITDEEPEALMTALRNGAYINIRNPAGWTPLMFASNDNKPEMVREMIAMAADCNRQENDGWTALHFAAMGGFESIVKQILAANGDHNLRNEAGLTARDMAKAEGFQNIVDLIPESHLEL